MAGERKDIKMAKATADKRLKSIPPPGQIMDDLMFGLWRPYALAAALEVDLFTCIKSGKRTAREIARDAGAHEGAMTRLLDAMVSMGYLRRRNTTYSLERVAETYFVRGSALYAEGAPMVLRGLSMGWSQLADVVRNGRPAIQEDPEARARQFFPLLVRSIFPSSYAAGRAAVASIDAARRKRISNILDVAAGAAPWSIPFAERIRKARVTVLDFPEVTPIAREYAERHGVGDRYDFIEGNLRETDFGEQRYDLVILGHIIHSEGAEWGRKLIEKSSVALRPGGLLLIGELIANNDRTGPAHSMLFSLNMLVHTPVGDVFTMREYREWMTAAGLRNIRTVKTPAAPSPLLFASK